MTIYSLLREGKEKEYVPSDQNMYKISTNDMSGMYLHCYAIGWFREYILGFFIFFGGMASVNAVRNNISIFAEMLKKI